MILLYCFLAALGFWYFFVTKTPKGYPKGPTFRLPLIGHLLQIGSDPIKGYRKLREK